MAIIVERDRAGRRCRRRLRSAAIVLLSRRATCDQKVTITGQFDGRNLLGDLPDAPANSRYDFVLRSADAAIWVTNLRPRGKDFELALDARIDTGRWLEVTGHVAAGARPAVDRRAERKPRAWPSRRPRYDRRGGAGPRAGRAAAEVVFSAPTAGRNRRRAHGDHVRIQFSRDLDPATFKGRVRVTYPSTPSARGAGTARAAGRDFTTEYLAANRVLEIQFAKPLERFRTVKVELLGGHSRHRRPAAGALDADVRTGGLISSRSSSSFHVLNELERSPQNRSGLPFPRADQLFDLVSTRSDELVAVLQGGANGLDRRPTRIVTRTGRMIQLPFRIAARPP